MMRKVALLCCRSGKCARGGTYQSPKVPQQRVQQYASNILPPPMYEPYMMSEGAAFRIASIISEDEPLSTAILSAHLIVAEQIPVACRIPLPIYSTLAGKSPQALVAHRGSATVPSTHSSKPVGR